MAISFDTFIPKGKKELVEVVKIDNKFRGHGPQAIYDILTQSKEDKDKMLTWATSLVGKRTKEREQIALIKAEMEAKIKAIKSA